MQTLSEIVENAKRRSSEAFEREDSLSRPVDTAWEQVKTQVDQLSPRVGDVVQSYLQLGNRYVRSDKLGRHHKHEKVCGDLKRITVKIAPIEEKPVEMIAYECSECGIFNSWYVVFDGQNNRCYKRSL
jgi:hypothetical protein